MSAHFNALTGQFLLSEQLIPAGKGQFYDLQNGNIVFGDLLVPKLGKTLFDDATLDLNFAKNLSLTDSVSGDNLVTFSRASSGTYVGSDGLIKTSPVNLLTYSDYSEVHTGTTAILQGTVEGPDGTFTAKAYERTSGSTTQVQKLETTGEVGKDYTFSVWLRSPVAGTSVRFVVGSPFEFSQPQPLTTTWQRYASTSLNNDTNTLRAFVVLSDDGDVVELWGAQLEEGTTATDYIPTQATISGAPRFDHDPATGESLGLLIEEARTNLVTYSDYSQVQGTTDAQLEGTAVAPDGTNTARRYSYPSLGLNSVTKITSNGVVGNDYTFSVYIRSTGTASSAQLFVGDPGEPTNYSISTTWQRFSATKSNNGSNLVRGYVNLINVGDEIEVWGAQIEEGSFPTSYLSLIHI